MSGIGAAILGLEGPGLLPDEANFFRDSNPFGFILFARNIETPIQLSRLTADLRSTMGRDVPIFVDQEGGRVQRLRSPHWREWLPPLEEVARLRPLGPEAMARGIWLRHRIIAAELRAVGIDGNCAPTCDLACDATHPFLKNRCFSSDVAEVVDLAREAANGLLAGGVLPVIKHMPGHGRAVLDTHKALPVVDTPLAELLESDFAVFKGLADLPLGMTAHLVFSAIDDHPATQSAAMIRVIRGMIGFRGLLMSDDLNMEALSGSLGRRTAAAMAAGCDIALHCKGLLSEMVEVMGQAGTLTPSAETRAAAAFALRSEGCDVDITALAAEHAALVGGACVG